jgi:hypothetical protein
MSQTNDYLILEKLQTIWIARWKAYHQDIKIRKFKINSVIYLKSYSTVKVTVIY